MILFVPLITKPIMTAETETRNYYSRAMIDSAEKFLWENFGIPVGTDDYKWSKDQLIEEATKKGWKFTFY
jgi:hypothetical protein